MRKPTCERCGDELPWVDITNFGAPEPRYLAAGTCPCPRPRCPFCRSTLDAHGRCTDIDCFLVGHVVPIPEMA